MEKEALFVRVPDSSRGQVSSNRTWGQDRGTAGIAPLAAGLQR